MQLYTVYTTKIRPTIDLMSSTKQHILYTARCQVNRDRFYSLYIMSIHLLYIYIYILITGCRGMDFLDVQ